MYECDFSSSPVLSALKTRSLVPVTMSLSSLYGALLGVVVLYLIKLVAFPKQTAAPLPPGPKPKPIIGNLGDLPPPGQQDWKHWLHFKELYGVFHSLT